MMIMYIIMPITGTQETKLTKKENLHLREDMDLALIMALNYIYQVVMHKYYTYCTYIHIIYNAETCVGTWVVK